MIIYRSLPTGYVLTPFWEAYQEREKEETNVWIASEVKRRFFESIWEDMRAKLIRIVHGHKLSLESFRFSNEIASEYTKIDLPMYWFKVSPEEKKQGKILIKNIDFHCNRHNKNLSNAVFLSITRRIWHILSKFILITTYLL